MGTGRWRTELVPRISQAPNNVAGIVHVAESECCFPLTLLHNLWYPLFFTARVDMSQATLRSKSISRFCKKKRKKTVEAPQLRGP